MVPGSGSFRPVAVSPAVLQDEKELQGEGEGQGQEGKNAGWGSSVLSVSGRGAQEAP